ncbi:MAG TPA: ATP-grasp domain-containing protein [Pseudomonas sp.]|nr:ATP-grasp domain-containing protein [Pseudomonas sp.]
MTNPCTDAGKNPLVLVDAYSTGALLARALAEHRPLIHVASRSNMPAAFAATCPANLFIQHYNLHELGFDPLCQALATQHPSAVLTGSEFGVELADSLAAALGLPGNDPGLSASRRDKAQMAERVAAAGLPVAAQLRTGEVDQACQWFLTEGSSPVVLKPLDSAGSDQVFICKNVAQVREAANSILGSTNLMMRQNHEMLAQAYLEGDEYVLNTVSHQGRHWLTDAWICTKTLSADGRKIYDSEYLLHHDDRCLPALIEYVEGVLNALAISEGPAHTEVILTADGPRLLETGARLSGLANPPALQLATGADQIDLTIEACLKPEHLRQRPGRYQRLQAACTLNLIARSRGRFDLDQVSKQLNHLTSFHSARWRFHDGRALVPTVDLNSSPGAVFMVHPQPDCIRQDQLAWRTWEQHWL